MPQRLAFLILAAMFVPPPAVAGTNGSAPARPVEHVRAAGERVKRILRNGLAWSPSLRHAYERLQSTDVIVYVDAQPLALGRGLGGCITFLGAGGGTRYVRVSLNTYYADEALIALLGHELQHAIELVGAPEVRSSRALSAFYERIGIRSASDRLVDTREAQEMGSRVRTEVADRATLTIARAADTPDEPIATLSAWTGLVVPRRP